MASGSLLSAFSDFVLSTGPAFLKGPEDVINEAVKNTYTLPHFIEGKPMEDMLQGGQTIKDIVYFDEKATFENYQPNASFTYQNPQVLTEWSVPWRFSRGEMVWTDHEILLNTGGLSQGGRHQKFKTLKRAKEMDTWTAFVNGLDSQMWAVPETTKMEATDGDTPYSLYVYNNEFTAGVYPATTPDATAWTTIMGINPASQAKWDNYRDTYAPGKVLASDTGFAADHLFQSLTKAWWKVKFDRLPRRGDLSDPVRSPGVIFTQLQGMADFEQKLQANQDAFVYVGRQDPSYNAMTFRGIPMMYVSDLDTAAAYPTGSAAAQATATLSTFDTTANTTENNAGPRYHAFNGHYILKTFHNERYFYKKPPFQPSSQPFTNVMVCDTWHNTACRSRQRHFTLYPDTTTG